MTTSAPVTGSTASVAAKKDRVLYAKPSITELEVRYAADAAANGWGESCYGYIHRFEAAFSQHIGTSFAIATSSCTGALHLGMAALDIGAGDEVIMADTNWIASAAPIVHLGATPIFIDIRPDTWCIDPTLIERAITPRTKAILAVHLYGNLCEMDEILAIGKRYGLPIIEDAAEAIGSQYRGRRAGSMGAFAAFSFHGSKTVTTGEGGMFVTNDQALCERALTLSNHGRSRSQTKQFWPDVVGYKYKMSNIQAALGCAQMERIGELIRRKREIFHYYRDRLSDVPGISMNPDGGNVVNGAWMPTVVFDRETGVTREKLVAAFSSENIDARVFFYPLSGLPMFSSMPQNKHASDLPERAINLPSFHDITPDNLDRVVNTVLRLVRIGHEGQSDE